MPHPNFKTAEITPLQYAESVSALLKLARKDCGGSRSCAQVLLSAHNGNEVQLDITDLCLLDDDYYAHAMTVIRGRVELGTEPHELIVDGELVFDELWHQWSGYHISERGK